MATNFGPQTLTSAPAMGARQGAEQANAITWAVEADKVVEDLFKGATSSSSGGDYKEWCEDNHGKIKGNGPNCVPLKEEGERDTAVCFYNATLDCIQEFRDVAFSSTREFLSIAVDNYDKWTSNSGSGYGSLQGPRERFEAGKNAYDDCVEEIENLCECKRCVWTFNNDEDDTEAEDQAEPDDPVNSPPDPTTGYDDNDGSLVAQRVTTSSSYGIIPRVFGEYVVGGNIIWLGTVEERVTTYYAEDAEGLPANYTLTNSFIDFIAGISIGEVDSLLRVWFNDVLVLSQVINPDDLPASSRTDIDLSLFADNPEDLINLYTNRPQIELHRGTSSQRVLQAGAELHGFGKAPAYRDLAFVYFSNIDLRLFGGSFPQIRFDVTSLPPQATTPKLDSLEIADVYTPQMSVDVRTARILMQTTEGEYVELNYNTLEESARGSAPSGDYISQSHYANMASISFDGSFILKYTSPSLNRTLDERTIGSYVFESETGFLTKTLKVYDSTAFPQDVILWSRQDGGVDFASFDVSRETFDNLFNSGDSLIDTSEYIIYADALTSTANVTSYHQFALHDTTQTQLRIASHVVKRDGQMLDPTPDDQTLTTIDKSLLWGTDTTGVRIANVIVDSTDNSFIVFFILDTSEEYHVVKISSADYTVQWTTQSPTGFGPWSAANEAYTRFGFESFYFLSSSSELVRLTPSTGVIEIVGTLASLSLEPYVANDAQFYDGLTKSITYISQEGGRDPLVTRVFLDRVVTAPVSIADIVKSIATRAGVPSTILDTTGIASVEILGAIIDEPLSTRQVIERYADFYQISVVDDGTRLSLVRQADLTTLTAVDSDNEVVEFSLKTSRVVESNKYDSASVSFVTIGDAGLDTIIQTVSLRGDDDLLKAPKTVDFALKVYDTAENIRVYLEQALEGVRSTEDIFEASLLPKHIGITPNDRITSGGKIYRVTQQLLGPNNDSAVSATIYSEDRYSTFASLTSTVPSNARQVDRTIEAKTYKPVVLFINAMNSDDALRAISTKQVAYTAIEAASADIPETRINFRVQAHTGREIFEGSYGSVSFPVSSSPTYTSQAHTKAAHFGFLESAPRPFTFGEQFTSNADDTLRVRFARADSLGLFTTFADSKLALEEPTTNLLIVGNELIQFSTYTIDGGDPLVVTFSGISRGLFGTDPYMTHSAGERVYLYTPDTILSVGVDSEYTKRRATVKMYLPEAVPAGEPLADFATISDAGSSRPWAPTHLKVYAKNGDNTDLQISFKRRNNYLIDHLEYGGVIPNDFGSLEFFVNFSSSSSYSVTSFNSANMDVADNDVYGLTLDDEVVADFVLELSAPPTTSARIVYVAQIVRDSAGEPLVGHPAIVRVWPGNVGTYPSS